MAKANSSPTAVPRLMMVHYLPEFSQVDYVQTLNGPFDASVPLQAKLAEAEVKDCVVVINVSLVPAAKFYEIPPEGEKENGEEAAGQ